MFKYLVVFALLAIAAFVTAEPEPVYGYHGAPVAYSAGYGAPYAYGAYGAHHYGGYGQYY